MGRSFNGTSDRIAVNAAHVTNGQNAFTIAMWVSASIAQASSKDPYGEGFTGNTGPFFQIQGDASGHAVISARSGITGSSDQITGTVAVFDATWHHLCVSQNAAASATFKLFIDAIADGTKTRTSLSNQGNQGFDTTTLGALVRNTIATFYGGKLAHVALWKRELSVGEIKSLAAGMLPSELAPAHYWPLWGTDSPEPDIGDHSIAAGVNGTLIGTTAASGGPMGRELLVLARPWIEQT
jgi:hypothetical protein